MPNIVTLKHGTETTPFYTGDFGAKNYLETEGKLVPEDIVIEVANIATRTSDDLTVSGATVTAPAGYYAEAASKAVGAGSQGTPVATKGTVSNNSITVTPSCTDTTGYITGTTKTGTGVTVTASELVSGTHAFTANTTSAVDVSSYQYATVSIPEYAWTSESI